MNNLPKVVTQQRRGQASNPRQLDRKSDALPLSHRDRDQGETVTATIIIFNKNRNTTFLQCALFHPI